MKFSLVVRVWKNFVYKKCALFNEVKTLISDMKKTHSTHSKRGLNLIPFGFRNCVEHWNYGPWNPLDIKMKWFIFGLMTANADANDRIAKAIYNSRFENTIECARLRKMEMRQIQRTFYYWKLNKSTKVIRMSRKILASINLITIWRRKKENLLTKPVELQQICDQIYTEIDAFSMYLACLFSRNILCDLYLYDYDLIRD